MKAIISCFGKFHAFNLAEQLNKYGHLYKLITPFYSQKTLFPFNLRKDIERINNEKVVTNFYPFILEQIFNKFNLNKYFNGFYKPSILFDKWAASQIEDGDLLIVWSNAGLNTLRAAKNIVKIRVVERGSTHILFQKEILEEEFKRFNVQKEIFTDSEIENELIQYEEADFISIPSKFAKKTYIDKNITPSKLIQIPYGVNLDLFKTTKKYDTTFRVVFAGGLSLRKGVHYLLEAFSKLNLKNAELLLIGSMSSEIKPFLRKYDGFYKYIGKVPHISLAKYLSQGSVFVLPSIEEGLAMVLLQAMACKLPVICTTNSGGEDLIKNGQEGFIIPIRDIGAIQEKILYLYENPDAVEEMGLLARKKVESEFSWEHYGEKIIAEYRRIVK